MFTILIVEDSKEILDLMVLHLEDKYNLIKAEDGINAIKIAKKEKIDLLILDIIFLLLLYQLKVQMKIRLLDCKKVLMII